MPEARSSLLLCLLVLVLGLLACASFADETRSWTGQLNTTASRQHWAVAIRLKFDSASSFAAYSVVATTTINNLRAVDGGGSLNPDTQLSFDHTLLHPVNIDNNKNAEEGFSGPTHAVLPANASSSAPWPRAFVDRFGPCELTTMFGFPLDTEAVFFANRAIEVDATVRVDLLTDDVVVVAADDVSAVQVPVARTQYFSVDLPDNVRNLIVRIDNNGDGDITPWTAVNYVFGSLTVGCGNDAKTLDNLANTMTVPYEKGGRVFVTLQMAPGVPVPDQPLFSLSFSVETTTNDEPADEINNGFLELWVIGVICGSGVAVLALFVALGVVAFQRHSRRRTYRQLILN